MFKTKQRFGGVKFSTDPLHKMAGRSGERDGFKFKQASKKKQYQRAKLQCDSPLLGNDPDDPFSFNDVIPSPVKKQYSVCGSYRSTLSAHTFLTENDEEETLELEDHSQDMDLDIPDSGILDRFASKRKTVPSREASPSSSKSQKFVQGSQGLSSASSESELSETENLPNKGCGLKNGPITAPTSSVSRFSGNALRKTIYSKPVKRNLYSTTVNLETVERTQVKPNIVKDRLTSVDNEYPSSDSEVEFQMIDRFGSQPTTDTEYRHATTSKPFDAYKEVMLECRVELPRSRSMPIPAKKSKKKEATRDSMVFDRFGNKIKSTKSPRNNNDNRYSNNEKCRKETKSADPFIGVPDRFANYRNDKEPRDNIDRTQSPKSMVTTLSNLPIDANGEGVPDMQTDDAEVPFDPVPDRFAARKKLPDSAASKSKLHVTGVKSPLRTISPILEDVEGGTFHEEVILDRFAKNKLKEEDPLQSDDSSCDENFEEEVVVIKSTVPSPGKYSTSPWKPAQLKITRQKPKKNKKNSPRSAETKRKVEKSTKPVESSAPTKEYDFGFDDLDGNDTMKTTPRRTTDGDGDDDSAFTAETTPKIKFHLTPQKTYKPKHASNSKKDFSDEMILIPLESPIKAYESESPALPSEPVISDAIDLTSSQETLVRTTVDTPTSAGSTMAKGKQQKESVMPKKAMKLYNARSWNHEEEEDELRSTDNKCASKYGNGAETNDATKQEPSVTREVTQNRYGFEETTVAVKVTREHKKLFTVVSNVKNLYECHEAGETQQFRDDIEYLMEDIRSNDVTRRSLSIIDLIKKCLVPNFRMHLRAEGIFPEILATLSDAPKFPSLALCTAMVMFVLSRDHLSMDVEHSGLELLIDLIAVEPVSIENTSSDNVKEYKKNLTKVKNICETILRREPSKSFDIHGISTAYLSMEVLLRLAWKQSSSNNWLREAVRKLGGFAHIVETLEQCSVSLLSQNRLSRNLSADTMQRVQLIPKCLKALENLIPHCKENARYLLDYKDGALITAIAGILKTCEKWVMVYPVNDFANMDYVPNDNAGRHIFDCSLSALKVLINLTNGADFDDCMMFGEEPGMLHSALMCAVELPRYAPQSEGFDQQALALMFLVNVLEHCEMNREWLLGVEISSFGEEYSDGVFVGLAKLFMRMENAARTNDQLPKPKILEDEYDEDSKTEEFDFTNAVLKATTHMRDNMVASLLAIIVGQLVQGSKELVDVLKGVLADGGVTVTVMTERLKRFYNIMNLAGEMSASVEKHITNAISLLETY